MDRQMRANEGVTPAALPLDYARRVLWQPKGRHSFFSVLALIMAGVAVVWLYCVENCHPRYHQGGPIWSVFYENACWPGGIGLVLAVVGLAQPGRRRVLSVGAIVVTVLAYVVWFRPMSFA